MKNKKLRQLRNILYKYLASGNWGIRDFDYRWKNHTEVCFRPAFFNATDRYNTLLESVKNLRNTNRITQSALDFKTAYDLFVELKMSDEELLALAIEIKALKPENQKTYQREKDNSIWQKSFSPRSNSNRNKVRLPKKCRKTAWKRFYKLFPEYDKSKPMT